MILMIDNYDSFVFNLARYFERVGEPVVTLRNDAVTLDEIETLAPRALVISPGPCGPRQAGISLDCVRRFSGRIPILGVCLGHQVIGEAFGGEVGPADEPMHGRASVIRHDGSDLFQGLPTDVTVGRYHSLIVRSTDRMDQSLRVTARSKAGEIMAFRHHRHPTWSIQFHPESILTPDGAKLLGNFRSLIGRDPMSEN